MKIKQVNLNGGVEADSNLCLISHSNRLVYIRYKDHVLFRNSNPRLYFDVVEREAIGWLIHETDDSLCILNDRSVHPVPNELCESGFSILKSDVVETREIK